jgi:O-antigen ligase
VFTFSLLLVSQFGKHFFFPFSYLSGIRIDYLAPTLYLTDIFSFPFIIVAIIQIYKHIVVIKKWIQNNSILCLFIATLFILNFVFSLSKPLWFYNFARLSQCLFVFIYFYISIKRKWLYSSFVWGLFLGGCIELILSLLQLSSRHSLQGVWYFLGERNFSIFTPGIAKAYFMGVEFLRPYGTFSHPNSLGGFYLLIYTFILTQKRVTNIVFKRIFLIINSALILISFSRGAIIAYVIINLLYYTRAVVTCKTCTLSKVIIGCILILFALNISGDLNSLQKRTDFFEKSLSIISKKPFTGTGVGSYLIAQHDYPQKFSTFFEQPVHNIFLLIMAQLGIPLSILFVVLIYQKIRSFIKMQYFFLPLLSVLLTGVLDHYWITLQQNLLVLVVISGILWAAPKSKI